MLLSDEAIRKHLRDYQKLNKLYTNNGGGFAKLDKSSQQELSRHLEENNYVLVKDICVYVENKYGLKYTVSSMTRLLYKMGFVYKKPKLVSSKLDVNKQEEFKLQYKLLKFSLKANEVIYFMDSVHPQYQARSRYGWIKKGKDKTLPTNSGWKRKHIIGIINSVKSLEYNIYYI
ncbi:winged helix-turn-helix domain-containing protein [Candidatus Tisiphia endosymbiont of Mystacides longicornis]|uniref:winged helix-turn-helix domain-containing protein n=1 Tax=Candidatus Tisiphia endosymbiont of Mystacides longicornis TaxID=3139330 RepID=UPI003CCB0080